MAKALFSKQSVHRHFDDFSERIERAIIRRLQVLGEECVNIARSVNSYKDQTGNLRSGNGYVIVVRGRIVEESFDIFLNGAEGAKNAKAYAELLAKSFTDGYALIVVNGMEYARTVEARSIDVLTTAEQYAEQKLPGMIAQLKINISK